MRSADSDVLEYIDASVSYRAPRAAVLIRGDSGWIFWARQAIRACCAIWGGSGFVLVPHANGVVDPAILRAVRAYDPDYVVTLPVTMGQFDALHPGEIEAHLEAQRKTGIDEAAIESLRSQMKSHVLHFDDDAKARDAVVAACSPYRMALGGDAESDKWTERVNTLRPSDDGYGPFTPLHLATAKPGPTFGAKATLNSPFGLLVANAFGLVGAPTADPGQVDARDEERCVQAIAGLRSKTLVRPDWSCFDQVYVDGAVGDMRSAWLETETELVRVNDYRYNASMYVVGNAPEDFCLALIWERLYGHSLWVPDELWIPEASPLADKHRSSLVQGMMDLTRSPSGMVHCLISSISEDQQRLELFRNEIFDTEPLIAVYDGVTGEPRSGGNRPREENVFVTDHHSLVFPDRGRNFLGLRRHFHRSTTLPVIRDSEGGVTLAASAEAPVIDAPEIAAPTVSFHIDLDIPSVTMPQGRALPPAALNHQTDNYLERYRTWVRIGRAGVSYESLRYDFVQAGILPEERLARPRIKKPGMMTWARAKAEMSGCEAQVSDAGWPAHVLASMCGSRQTLIELFSGLLRPALLMFVPQPAGTGTSKVFDNKDGQRGAVVNRSVYLTLLGFESLCGSSTEEVRQPVDQLLSSGILNRGLLLRCSICRMSNFHTVDSIGRVVACPRCGNVDDFTHARYQVPAGEPDWFYDLHPLGRDLMQDHADVPMLLAAYLRQQAKSRYSDTPEIVVLRGRKMLAEADLVAVADGKLIVGEAKVNDSLGQGDAESASVQARLRLAEVFDADEIVMATTAASWRTRSLNAMATAVSTQTWPNGLAPRVRAITSLGVGGAGSEIYL